MTTQNKTDYPYDFPMQPTYIDKHGTIRFAPNKIVEFILEHSQKTGCDLNHLAIISEEQGFTPNDWRQFAQLHGYSVGGFCDLSYVSNTWNEERLEDGYPEYLEQQVPEYFDPDSAGDPTDEEGYLTAIEKLARTIEEQAVRSNEVQRMLQGQLDEQTDRADKATEELGQLRTTLNNILESKHIFHRCGDKIRTYPALACSMARPGTHSPDDDFDALDEIKRQQERGDRIWATLREIAYSYDRGEPYHEVINIMFKMFQHPDSPPENRELVDLLRDEHLKIRAEKEARWEDPNYELGKIERLEERVAELEAEKATWLKKVNGA